MGGISPVVWFVSDSWEILRESAGSIFSQDRLAVRTWGVMSLDPISNTSGRLSASQATFRRGLSA